eukprot:10680686-Ditylum_brightwellii.AAC.1
MLMNKKQKQKKCEKLWLIKWGNHHKSSKQEKFRLSRSLINGALIISELEEIKQIQKHSDATKIPDTHEKQDGNAQHLVSKTHHHAKAAVILDNPKQDIVDTEAHLHLVMADDDAHPANVDNKGQENVNREAPTHPVNRNDDEHPANVDNKVQDIVDNKAHTHPVNVNNDAHPENVNTKDKDNVNDKAHLHPVNMDDDAHPANFDDEHQQQNGGQQRRKN